MYPDGTRQSPTGSLLLAFAAAALMPGAPLRSQAAVAVDPFAFFKSDVTLSGKELASVTAGQPFARIVPSREHEVAVFAAVAVKADATRLIAWIRDIVALKKSPMVLAIGRLSSPPRLEDVANITLDDDDLAAIRKCRVGDCGLKLAGPEMRQLQAAAASRPADWKDALQAAFRALVIERARAYSAGGLAALPPYDDSGHRPGAAAVFHTIMTHSTSLTAGAPAFADYLTRYPAVTDLAVESFLYWSKEKVGGKAQINLTHVSILRCTGASDPAVIIAAEQVFSTHYIDGSLAVTALLRGTGSTNYLVYLNRSDVDAISGFFGGLIRFFVERRLKSDSPGVLNGLRQRLESGDPPDGERRPRP